MVTEGWTKRESQVINGLYPLRRFLSGSDHSGVFLTEYRAQNIPNAAIKLIPADPERADAQLSRWKMAMALAHPHLIRLFDAGRCQLGSLQFLFVVMEYAEETLAQILPHRALTADEVREMLPPALGALAFLHRRNLVQGQMKPANFLVVNDQLKLASDAIRPAGESPASTPKPSPYYPPEAMNGGISAAGDIWGLGITLVEALTQSPPATPGRAEPSSMPANTPPAFADTIRQCLSRNPANRPTVTDLEAQLKRAPPAPLATVSQPVVSDALGRAGPPDEPPRRHWLVPAIIAFLILLAALWGGLRLFPGHPQSQQPAAQNPQMANPAPSEVITPSSRANATEPKPLTLPSDTHASDQPARPLGKASPSVLHEEIPAVPRRSRDTIHGHVRVTVRVIVDSSGKVVRETLENSGTSRYFAGLAAEAARKWKFAPAHDRDSREWLLRFEFTRGGTTGHATARRP